MISLHLSRYLARSDLRFRINGSPSLCSRVHVIRKTPLFSLRSRPPSPTSPDNGRSGDVFGNVDRVDEIDLRRIGTKSFVSSVNILLLARRIFRILFGVFDGNSLDFFHSSAQPLVYKFSQEGLAKMVAQVYVMHALIRSLCQRRLAVVANAWSSSSLYGSVRLRSMAYCPP